MITIKIAGFSPIPTNGTEKAKRAIQGIDCNKLAIPMIMLAKSLFLVIIIPSGIPVSYTHLDVYKRQLLLHLYDL